MIKKILDPISVILFVLLITVVLTWIPHEVYSSEAGALPIPNDGKYGIIDIPLAILVGFQEMFPTFLYVITSSILFLLLDKYYAFDRLFENIKKGTGNNKYFLITIICLFVFSLSSIIGFFEQFIIFVPILIPIFGVVGIDKKRTTIFVIIAACLGRCFSTLSPYSYQIAFDIVVRDMGLITYSDLNGFVGIRFILMLLGLITMVATINFIEFFFGGKDVINQEKDKDRRSEFEIGSKQKISIFLSWILFAFMVFILILSSFNFQKIMGDSYGLISNFLNEFLFANCIKPMDQWGNYEKVIIMASTAFVIFAIFKFTSSSSKWEDNIINKSLLSMLKVYAVFSISKSISLILIYSGLANSIASLITWKSSPVLFIIAMIPIIYALTLLMNSQTGAMMIFTPIIASIIFNSNFSNSNLVFVSSIALINLIVGINSIYTPTQSFSSILMNRNEIGYLEYAKIIGIPILLILIFFSIIVIPLLTIV